MITPNETSLINETVFELSVIAVNETRLRLLNFTWSTTKFLPNSCTLKILFTNPLYVSSEIDDPDYLLLRVIEPTALVSAENGWRINNLTASEYQLPLQTSLGAAISNL